jgi:hypothetical protein
MSGGHYNYKYYKLSELADDIERDFLKDGKYLTEDWSTYINYDDTRPMIEEDRIGDATDDQKIIILNEIRTLINDLRKCSSRSKELEWYMSGDTSADSYLKRLKERNLI